MKSLTYFVFLLLGAASLPADAIYNVSVNTGAFSGQSGYLDFQLGRGPSSQAATVAITSFASNGASSSLGAQISGAVTGSLSSTVNTSNTTQFNDYFQAFTYGSALSFQLTFSGPAINAPNGTATDGSPFAFGLYNSSQSPIGQTDAFGNTFLIQVNTNGTTTVQNFSTLASVTAAVPEPGEWGVTGVGLIGVALATRRKLASNEKV